MANSKKINSLLSHLEEDDEEFISTLEKFIEFNIAVIENTEEIWEELETLNQTYQFQIYKDKENVFNFWIEVKKKKIYYEQGINENAQIHFKMSKDSLIKGIKRELSLTDYYMKGLIKINGEFYELIKLRNNLKYLLEYVLKKYGRE